MVKDINPGPGSSYIYGITAVNGILYFRADDGVHGAELWRSDGTARGTRMVKDINPGWPTRLSRRLHQRQRHPLLLASDGPGSGEATAPRRGRVWSRQIVGSPTSSTSAAPSTSPSRRRSTQGCGERRHRAGTSLVKQGFVGELEFTDFPAPSTSRRRRHPRPRAVAKRRHRAGHDHGQGLHSRLPLICPAASPKSTHPLLPLVGSAAVPNELWRSDGTEAGTTLVKRRQRRLL